MIVSPLVASKERNRKKDVTDEPQRNEVTEAAFTPDLGNPVRDKQKAIAPDLRRLSDPNG